MKYLLVLILVVSFSSCTNYDEKMRKFDASFTKMRKITSANVLNHELILGRPYIIHYADSSVVIYDDINDSIFTLIDLRDNNSVYHFGKRGEGHDHHIQGAGIHEGFFQFHVQRRTNPQGPGGTPESAQN